MRIFVFKSQTRQDLHAFAADITGTKLPERFGPWLLIGSAPHSGPLPHRFPRPAIERAIHTEGFQMWRLKAAAAAAAAT